MDKQRLNYNHLDEIGRNWDVQECMDLYVSKQKAKETYEAQFGNCAAHRRKTKFICEDDNSTLLCSECLITHMAQGHKLTSLVEV